MWIPYSELAEKGSARQRAGSLVFSERARGAFSFSPAHARTHRATGSWRALGARPAASFATAERGGACLVLDTGRAPACEATQPAPRVVRELRSARPSCRTLGAPPGGAWAGSLGAAS